MKAAKVTASDLDLKGMPDTKGSVLAYRLLDAERPEPRDKSLLIGFLIGSCFGFPAVYLVWLFTSWFTDEYWIRVLATAVTTFSFISALIDDASRTTPDQNARLTSEYRVPRES
jgi:hypothetical protein